MEVERIITSFLLQALEEGDRATLLLYNNSPISQTLGDFEIPENKCILLISNHLDLKTGQEYTNTGAIFRDAITFIPHDVTTVAIFDSDDIYLPNHLKEGIKGIKRAQGLGCLAYKPYYSYFLYENKCRLLHNTLEPSIFVNRKYLEKTGFNETAVTYHQKWIDLLVARKQLYVDTDGPSTMMYNWSENHGNHKISGGSDNEANFKAHRKWEMNSGDGVLDPAPLKDLDYFYIMAKSTKLETT